MDKRVTDLRLQHWTEIIHEANNSGLSKSEWCRQNNIRPRQFYYWQKALRERLLDQNFSDDPNDSHPSTSMIPVSKPDFFEITPIDEKREETFPVSPEAGASIEMKYGNFSFRIDDNSSEAALEKIIRVLSHA